MIIFDSFVLFVFCSTIVFTALIMFGVFDD